MSHYETLGVPRDASADEIKSAFRRKSKECHPDKGGTNESMAALNVAYDVLSDPTRRKVYDETGQDTEGPTIEQQAVKVIISIFETALDSPSADPIIFTRRELQTTMAAAVAEITTSQKSMSHLTSRRDKVKVKEGVNLAHMIIDRKVDGLKKKVAHLELLREVGKEALKVLDNYEFEGEMPYESKVPYQASEFAALSSLFNRGFR